MKRLTIKVWPDVLEMAQEYLEVRNQYSEAKGENHKWNIEAVINILVERALEDRDHINYLKEMIVEHQQEINKDLTTLPGN